MTPSKCALYYPLLIVLVSMLAPDGFCAQLVAIYCHSLLMASPYARSVVQVIVTGSIFDEV